MAVEVRPIGRNELRPWFEAIFAAFGEDLHDDLVERAARVLETDRTLAAYDGERIVGGAAAFLFRLTVPGGRQVGAAGVTGVGVMPTHRRRGILRRLMQRQLADVRAAGEPLAILWASEGGIYQRFGYGLAALNASFEIARERATFRQPADWSGTVQLVDIGTAAATYPAIYDALAARMPGFYGRNGAWWDSQTLADPEYWRRGASRKFYLLHERQGTPTGYAMYRIKSEWDGSGSKSVLNVLEALAVDHAAEGDLWRYLFGVDLIARIACARAPVDHPLLLMLDEPRRLGLRVGDGLWLRIVDVPAALAGRGYAADDALVIEVVDEVMPEAAGRWRLVAHDGVAEVTPTDAPADLRLDTTDLAAIYLGAFSPSALAAAGRGEELSEGARERADRLFATTTSPWCPEVF